MKATEQYFPVVLFVMWFKLVLNMKSEDEILKGGINLNAIFPPLDMALMEISRSRFKQSKNSMLIP